MATRRKQPVQSKPVPAELTHDDILSGVARLRKRLSELEALDVSTIDSGSDPKIEGIELAIKTTIAQVFGTDTEEYFLLKPACRLDRTSYQVSFNLPGSRGGGTTDDDIRNGVDTGRKAAIALIQHMIAMMEERIEAVPKASQNSSSSHNDSNESRELNSRVFVVHGHDSEPKEGVARFLSSIGFEPIILHEQASQGMTVIEKVEAAGDVDFAVVLLTPDDEGAAVGEESQPRARQNVLLELGYFIGRLGRSRVCTLMRGNVELPSDFAGVVHSPYDEGGAWRQVIGKELQAAGHDVDWNLVMK